MAKVTVRFSTPSAVADDDMYSMCSTPLIASSSGVPTVCASTVGFAPVYTARTAIVGGVTSGYSLMGNAVIEINPAASTTSDSTTAKTGRSMKNREKRTGEAPISSVTAVELLDGGEHGRMLRGDLHPRAHAKQAVDHDVLAGSEAGVHDAQAIVEPTEAHCAVLHRAVGL